MSADRTRRRGTGPGSGADSAAGRRRADARARLEVAMQPGRRLLGRQWRSDVEALAVVAPGFAQPLLGRTVLHALRRRAQPEVARQVDGGPDDHPVLGAV